MRTITWLKRVGLGLLALLCLSLAAGLVFERISRANAERIPPDGDFAQVEGHRLHYLKKGAGSPTVVFESAFDPSGHLQWLNIQDSLPETFTTLSYDRAGILWSDRGSNPKSGDSIARELHALLEQVNAPKPYILVGHSFGGTLARIFVHKYPEDVAGLILVDSQFPDDRKYLSPALHEMVNRGLPGGFLKFANAVGLARIMFGNMFPDTEQYRRQNAMMPALLHRSAYAVLEEQDRMPAIKQEAGSIASLGRVPLLVVTAAGKGRFDAVFEDEASRAEMTVAWSRMQKDLLHLSTDSRQILAPASGHYIDRDQPGVIEDAIREMAGRSGK